MTIKKTEDNTINQVNQQGYICSNVLDYISNPILIISIDTRSILYQNKAISEIFGHNELIDHFHINNFSGVNINLSEYITDILKIQSQFKDKISIIINNVEKKYELETTEIDNNNILLKFNDITEVVKKENNLFKAANYDYLTGLANRRYFLEILQHRIIEQERRKNQYALLYLDLDGFKEINDTFGHEIGDKVLKEVSNIFKIQIRKWDIIARMGGDEFSILLDDIKSISDAEEVSLKIINNVSKKFTIDNNQINIGISIGISLPQDINNKANELIKKADIAMYRAKKTGKGKVVFFNYDMEKEVKNNYSNKNKLKNAINNNDLKIYYQAKVDKNDNIIGFESIIKWTNTNGNEIVSPSELLDIAKKNNLNIKLGAYLLEKVCNQSVKLRKSGYNPGVISINISLEEIKYVGFINYINNILEETGCKAEWLEFEIKEEYLLNVTKESREKIIELSKIGIKISIDELGTGFSNLFLLKSMPVSVLKISKSFIDNLVSNQSGKIIVNTIIHMSKILGLDLVAKGVETKEQKLYLNNLGCNNIQGIIYRKEIPEEEIKELLEKK